MKYRGTIAVAALMVLVTVALPPGATWAQARKIPVEGGFTCYLNVPAAQRAWTTGVGNTHFRGVPVEAVWDEGPFTGSGVGVVNANFDAEGNGNNWGSVEVFLNYEGLSGTFRETYSAQNTADGCATGKAIFHGVSGDFVGWQMQVSYKSVTEVLFYEYRFTYWGVLIKR